MKWNKTNEAVICEDKRNILAEHQLPKIADFPSYLLGCNGKHQSNIMPAIASLFLHYETSGQRVNIAFH